MKTANLCAALVAVPGLALAGLACQAADWPQFLGPSRNSISTETGLLSQLPAGGPKVLWSAKVGTGYGGACVQDGKVFLLDREGDKRDVLRCWDLAGGKEEWSFGYDAPGKVQYPGSRSTPAADADHIYTMGGFGHFHCVSRKTHESVWNAHMLDGFGGKLPIWGVAQSPLLYKNFVIVAPHAKQGGVVAFEKATGNVAWKTPQFGVMCYDSPILATIEGVEMIVASGIATQKSCNVVGIDAAKGTILWRYSGWGRPFPIPSPTYLGDGRILLSGEYGAGLVLIQIKKAEGGQDPYSATEVFNLSATSITCSQIHQPALYKDHLYFVSNGFNRAEGLVCMDLTGKVLWKTGNKPNFGLGGWILADDKLFLLDAKTGELKIVKPEPAGYKELASAKVLQQQPMSGPVVIADGKLLVRDGATLKCLDVKDGGK